MKVIIAIESSFFGQLSDQSLRYITWETTSDSEPRG